ncbi:MAG: ferredoxin [Gemmatimonadota bacterium]
MAAVDLVELQVGELTVRIDRLLCVGFGDCITEAPDAFALDAEGIAEFTPATAGTARELLLKACAACPVDALAVLDGDGAQLVP